MTDLFSVKGKKALITGGRRGLGRAIAEGLIERGADVVCVATQTADEALHQMAEMHQVTFHSLVADLCLETERQNLCQKAADLMGGLDILINNAGVQFKAPLSEYANATFRADYALMVEAPFDLARQAAGIIQNGSIINISSISGFQGARNISGYTTAKHAVIGLTKALANELAPNGIRVNCIAPGLFETDMAQATTHDPQKRTELLGRIPAGRFGAPCDIVGPVIFLCSDAARHVHGATLLVDGGWMGR